MHTFKNDAGRKFVLPLNPTTVGRVYRETGFDLRAPEKLSDDLEHAVVVLHSIARRECVSLLVEDLKASLPGAVLKEAIAAVEAAMVDYFPSTTPPPKPKAKPWKPSKTISNDPGDSPSTPSR
jgi:hypothetical protein